MLSPRLRAILVPLANRRRHSAFWFTLAASWALAALAGLGLLALQKWTGWWSTLALPLSALLGCTLAAVTLRRHRRQTSDWRALVRDIEFAHPDLDGSLLTAAQQQVNAHGEFDYLQQRVLDQALAHHRRVNWASLFPAWRAALAHATHFTTLAFFAVVLWNLRVPGARTIFVPGPEMEITVTPGDTIIERGSSLVVMARFERRLPARVELVIDHPVTPARTSMTRNLADPIFGSMVSEVSSNLTYHLEYAGRRTRDYQVTTFEYPRLQRADADIRFPDYTGLPPKHVPNTRRVSAVEGSQVDLQLQFNKPIARATLISRDTNRSALQLTVEANLPLARLTNLDFTAGGTYELQLIDPEGRTNKLHHQLVFDVLKNRTPEIKLTSPAGDTRPSALEEVTFAGTVWDDFGLEAYGLACSVPGKPTRFLELGRKLAGKEKHSLHYVLHLEDFDLQPDDLMTWFTWADDTGPDGKIRRTSGDLYFAEVRPFEEVFREGQSPSGGASGQQQQGEGGGPATRLAELQKQIISATWKLQREQARPTPGPSTAPEPSSLPNSPAPPPKTQRNSGVRIPGPSGSRAAIPETPWFAASGMFLSQRASPPPPSTSPRSNRPGARRGAPGQEAAAADLTADLDVVREALTQAREQAQAAKDQARDDKAAELWERVASELKTALDHLTDAGGDPSKMEKALAAEQAAYQALLKLSEREYSVTRSQNRQGGQSGRQQQMRRQLDQLDLAQAQSRYETERQAQPPQTPERREQLQVMSRLQELARRQQDINQKLQELQTALQEARSEAAREEVRRQLKRLQEDQQELLADADEVRQRMERSENQSRMNDQRQRMEQARSDLQRAAEAAQQGQTSQALAAGTRAQRELQQMREDLRRQSAGEFDQEMRQMRSAARDLARDQEQVRQKLETLNDPKRRTLSDTEAKKESLEQLARQRDRLTNLVEHASEISRQAEEAEPLMARELYDTLRKFSQDDLATLKQFQEEFLNRPVVPRDIYERLKQTEPSGAKALDLASEMLQQGLEQEASVAEARARAGINELKGGVERAASSVLGDDAQSLRFARDELDRLAAELGSEIAQAENVRTNDSSDISQPGPATEPQGEPPGAGAQASTASREPGQTASPAQEPTTPGPGERAAASPSEPISSQPGGESAENQTPGNPAQTGQQPGQAGASGNPNGSAQANANPTAGGEPRGGQPQRDAQRGANTGANRNGRNRGNTGTDQFPLDLDRLLDGRGGLGGGGPITGDSFAPWSDSLREVEELIDTPALRNDVTRAREQARQLRQDFRRNGKKPDWAAVRLQVLKPLVEVREQVTEELARREPREALVPIDRDPVPGRFSEFVRRYYERLGQDDRERPAEGGKPNK
jgi:hypothetical protein